MKIPPLLLLAMLSCVVISCTKNNSEAVYSLSLSGKWNVVTDTVATGAAIIDYSYYKGVAGDYFDFRGDGKCYVKEGVSYDTLFYNITSDTSLNIESFGFSNKALYTKPTDPYTSVMITSTGPYVPGGYDYRRVRLTR
ncbi:MAG TPA: hypothetical protein VG367_19275 [Mucilaginibacter sp.]|jgi:hypothetical protein|nr:hypothetical protein [Mucilaginibacter sp.]